MGKIIIEQMEFFAFHGHFEEEQRIGNKFLVDIEIETVRTEKAATTDHLKDALDYQQVYDLVSKQMAITSHLLEHVAGRIMEAIIEQFKAIISFLRIKVSKINPAMGGSIGKVSVILERKL